MFAFIVSLKLSKRTKSEICNNQIHVTQKRPRYDDRSYLDIELLQIMRLQEYTRSRSEFSHQFPGYECIPFYCNKLRWPDNVYIN